MVEQLPAAVVSATAGSGAAGAAGAASSVLGASGGILGLLYQVYKDQHLTGAQREANAFTAEQTQKAMDFAAGQTQAQMDFQERMANSQWQRAVKDMQAAGLNPALAYSQGSNAAPSGASAAGSAGSSVDPGRGLGLAETLSALSFEKDLRMKDQQIKAADLDNQKRAVDLEILKKDLSIRDEWNEATLNHVREQARYLEEQGNASRYQRQVLGPLNEALLKAQKELASKQGAKIDAEMVYTLWQNEFYERNHFWPGRSAKEEFWNLINLMVHAGSSPDYVPPQRSLPLHTEKNYIPQEYQIPAYGSHYP